MDGDAGGAVAVAAAEPGLRRRVATGAVLLALVVSALEGTAVTPAMPAVTAELGGAARYAWVFSAFLVASTVGVVTFGRLVDRWGRRPVFAAGMGLFLLGSAACGLAHSMGALILSRVVQGLGAGAIQPTTMTLSADLYTLRERASIQTLFTGAWGAANALGPLLGGSLVQHGAWRWVFWVNVPPGLLAVALLLWAYRDPPRPVAARGDAVGPLLCGAASALALLALERGGPLPLRGLAGLGALGLGALLVRQQRRSVEPLLDAALWAEPSVRAGLWGGLAAGGVLYAVSAYVPLWVVEQAHAPLLAGFALLAMLLGWMVGSGLGVRVLLRGGMRASVGGGFALAVPGALGLALVAGLGGGPGWAFLALPVLGLGLGPAASTSTIGPQAAVPWRLRGRVTGAIYAARMLGGALAVAVCDLGRGHPAAQFGMVAGLAVVAAVHLLRSAPGPGARDSVKAVPGVPE